MRHPSLGDGTQRVVSALLALGVWVGLAWAGPEEPPRAWTLEVRVVAAEDGRPLAGATLRFYDSDPRAIREGTSDGDGKVRWSLPLDADGVLHVRAEGRALRRVSVWRGRETVAKEQVVSLVKAEPLRGHVLEAEGDRPVAGARVRLRFVDLHLFEGTWWDFEEDAGETATDAEGAFVLRDAPAPPGRPGAGPAPYVAVEAAAQGRATVTLLLWKHREVPEDLVVRLPRGAVVSGTVAEADGSPAAGAEVRLALATYPEMLASAGDACVDPALLPGWRRFVAMSVLPVPPAVLPLHPTHRVLTDAAGRFDVPALVAGLSYVIRAEHDLGGRSRVATLAMPPEGGSVRADLGLRRDATASISVREGPWEIRDGFLLPGTTSRTVPGAHVVVRSWHAGDVPAVAEGTTDAEGRVTFEHLPCRSLELSVDGFAPEDRKKLDLRPGDMANLEFLRNTAPLRSVRGRVFDDLGGPLPKTTVCVSPGGFCTTTESDGRYALEVPDLTGLGVSAALREPGVHERRRTRRLPRGAVEALDFVLPRPARVSLVVEGPGAPSSDATLHVTSDGEAPFSESVPWTSGLRRRSMTLVCDPSVRRIAVDGGPFLPLVFEVTLAPGGEVTLPAKTLVPGLEVSGRLLGPDGNAVVAGTRRHAILVHQPGAWPEGRSGWRGGVPEVDGTFRIGGLRQGPAILDVEVRGDLVLRREISIAEESAPLEVRLPRDAALSVRVRDKAGRPVPLSLVRLATRLVPLPTLRTKDPWVRNVPADLAGRLDLDVPPGPYRLEVHRASAPDSVGASPSLSQDLDLPPGSRVSLDVRIDGVP